MAQPFAPNSSKWEWDPTYNRYRRYDYGRQEWVWQGEEDGDETETEAPRSDPPAQSYQPVYPGQATSPSYPSYGYSGIHTDHYGGTQRDHYGGSGQRRDTLVTSNSEWAQGVFPHFRGSHLNTTSETGESSSTGADVPLVIKNKPFRRRPKAFFEPGTVFQCLLNQEAGGPIGRFSATATQTTHTQNPWGQAVHTEVRMFVVMQDNQDYSSTCLSVQTYNGRGVSKPGLKKSNYAIIHSGSRPPQPMDEELPQPGEAGMRTPIKVNVKYQSDRLDPKSRINLRARHCCQQNWKVYKVGQIAGESWRDLWDEHRAAMQDDEDEGGYPPAPRRRHNS